MPGLPAPPLHYGLLATLSRKQGMKQGKLDLVTQFHTSYTSMHGGTSAAGTVSHHACTGCITAVSPTGPYT